MNQQVLTALGVKEIIIPDQVRTRGFTGNMLANQCHSNAAYLAKKYGGKRVSGFLILPNEEGYYDYLHHSIWLSPEGKYAEVTLKAKQRFAITEEKRYFEPSWTPRFSFSQIGNHGWMVFPPKFKTNIDCEELWFPEEQLLELVANNYLINNAYFGFNIGAGWDRNFLHSSYLRRLERKQAAVKRKARPN